MKFAEHLGAHITPEWRKQYIQYEEMKTMLCEAIQVWSLVTFLFSFLVCNKFHIASDGASYWMKPMACSVYYMQLSVQYQNEFTKVRC